MASRSWAFVMSGLAAAGLCISSMSAFAPSSAGPASAPATASAPASFLAQVEADFLRQQALRDGPLAAAALGGIPIGVEEDARGGCDGVKNGRFGFHTAHQDDPWWQVDLGAANTIDHIDVFNRCDSAGRSNDHIIVLVSNDGKIFTEIYRHDGTAFLGAKDKKPLRVKVGKSTRFVRLALKGRSYFYLDEVEVFSGGLNVALNRPCSQSSVSMWSVRHDLGWTPDVTAESVAAAARRGLRLAENLSRAGADVRADVDALNKLASQSANSADLKRLYLDVRLAVHRMALKNPLLDFDSIVFVKAAPTYLPHQSDQYYCWFSRPGGGVCVLEDFKSDQPRVKCLTESFAPGHFIGLDLSYDGKRVLFAYSKHYEHLVDLSDKQTKDHIPEDAFHHIYEIGIDGKDLRQLTRGKYDDFSARYLPDGGIVFLSTRKGTFLQTSRLTTALTAKQGQGLPDCYVRCGGGPSRPVAVFTLHRMDTDGGNMLPISAFENFEYTPAINNAGQIIYTRWDYIDRFNGHYFSLWSTNPDGTNAQLVYGNYTVAPQVVNSPAAIPNSSKLLCVASAHHSINGGSLILLDRRKGLEKLDPIVRLTPDVPFPETEAAVGMYYDTPWPLSEEHMLVGWADRPLPAHSVIKDTRANPVNAMGLYLYDSMGNLSLLHRDEMISSLSPIPVRPRQRPPAYAHQVRWDGPQEGAFLVQDVRIGLETLPRNTVKSLRIIGVPPKVQPQMNSPSLGVSGEEPGKFVLGTVPVKADGSAYFRVPSGLSVFFQALDADGVAVQTMRSLTYVQPGQTLSCVGCHEGRNMTPQSGRVPLAAMRAPSRIAPGPEGSWPLRYDQLVQPVLDKHCLACHRPSGNNPKAAVVDLSGPASMEQLLGHGNLRALARERNISIPGQGVATHAKLWAMLNAKPAHGNVKLDAESRARLLTWLDTYAQRQGHYSDSQEKELVEFRARYAPLLEPATGSESVPSTAPAKDAR